MKKIKTPCHGISKEKISCIHTSVQCHATRLPIARVLCRHATNCNCMIKQWDTHNLPSWLTRCLCWLVLVLVDTRISWYSYISWLVVWLGAIVTLGCGGYVIYSLTHSWGGGIASRYGTYVCVCFSKSDIIPSLSSV